ncbi:cytochrome c [uncultured Paracoccus sp.]|uniref:c-type cytochrome n=1 Tax=uncultured Paracoccus sp. TaxID=189685 RepID=UPI002616DAB2|nr:cytochrome c [uncultured Paracoccus sp.]
MRNGVVLATAVVVAGGLAWWALDRPSETATRASGGALAQVVRPATFSSEAELGAAAFTASCANCHGRDAAGVDGAGPPLVHRIYEPGHHADMAIVLAVRQGVRAHHWQFGDMAAVEGVSDGELAAIIAYLRELQRANGIG